MDWENDALFFDDEFGHPERGLRGQLDRVNSNISFSHCRKLAASPQMLLNLSLPCLFSFNFYTTAQCKVTVSYAEANKDLSDEIWVRCILPVRASVHPLLDVAPSLPAHYFTLQSSSFAHIPDPSGFNFCPQAIRLAYKVPLYAVQVFDGTHCRLGLPRWRRKPLYFDTKMLQSTGVGSGPSFSRSTQVYCQLTGPANI